MTRRVVIGYDDSQASKDAVAFGLTWCRSTGDIPIVATVYPEQHPLGAGRVDVEWATYVRRLGQETLERAQGVGGVDAHYRLVASSSAAHGLSDLADNTEAAAVVVGIKGGEADAGRRIGSVTDRLLHGATVPVTVVPEGWKPPAGGRITRVGVAFVDTRDGYEALRVAVRAVSGATAQLTLYSVAAASTETFSYLAGGRREEQELSDAARRSYRQGLEFAAAGVPPELNPRIELLTGGVVESLASLGPDDLDLLVCGSRGYGPVRRVLLGGVSRHLVRRSRVPLTVVPRAAGAG